LAGIEVELGDAGTLADRGDCLDDMRHYRKRIGSIFHLVNLLSFEDVSLLP